MSNQTLLPIGLRHEQRFDNFVTGENNELVASLTRPRDSFRGVWMYGESSSGRSHLLRSTCRESTESASYIGCEDYGADTAALTDALTHALRHGELIAIDDVGILVGRRAHEELLLGIYQRLIGSAGMLVVSHTESSLLTRFALSDLGSRMRAMMNFAIKPLDDEQKATLLAQRANARGFKISGPVLSYWLSRGPRGMTALLEDLEKLDRATLERQRLLTIPLLKQVLGY